MHYCSTEVFLKTKFLHFHGDDFQSWDTISRAKKFLARGSWASGF
jgi:hypothetical protein